jgi:hypothetical protein
VKVTAETITDEQLRELRDCGDLEINDRDFRDVLEPSPWASQRDIRAARERCAAAWNARHGGEP